jgi:hypothetical protein
LNMFPPYVREETPTLTVKKTGGSMLVSVVGFRACDCLVLSEKPCGV